MLSLEPNTEKVDSAVNQLAELLNVTTLTQKQKNAGFSTYAGALQRAGKHSAALAALENVILLAEGDNFPRSTFWLVLQRATSLSALGHSDDACKMINDHIDELNAFPKREQGMILVEVGKIFSNAKKMDLAQAYWERGLQALEGDQAEIEHYAGLLANLASLKLMSGQEQSEAEGIKMMDKAMELKISIGDLYGLANSHDMLAHFYQRTHRFERAITHFQQGLVLSRRVGDRHGLAQALINLGGLYCLMRQIGQARQCMKEAKTLAIDLNNPTFVQLCEVNLHNVELNARDFGLKGEIIGPNAKCLCGSGKTYVDCCGRADFEPINLPWALGGFSEDAQKIFTDLKAAGIKPTRLDVFLRTATNQERRNAWFKVIPQDGWHEVQELPDLASIHLRAAKEAAGKARQFPESYEAPLSALILSACAMEAFINQVIFFVIEVNRTDSIDTSKIPKEILADCHLYQRATELTQKWDVMGKALCFANWPPSPDLWDDFKRLVSMRNEFVHFKLAEYEQIIPPPKHSSKASKMLPPSVQPRQVHHGWAFKVLNPEMAEWAVKVADFMLHEFRLSYAATRRLGGTPTKQ